MSLLSILQGFYDSSTKVLSFDAQNLTEITGLDSKLDQFIGIGKFSINNVQNQPTKTGNQITFEGDSWDLAPTSSLDIGANRVTNIKFVFFSVSTSPELAVYFTLKDGWKFTDTLLALKGTFWDGVTSKSPSLLAFSTSKASDPVTSSFQLDEGLNFQGSIDTGQGIVEQFAWIMGGSTLTGVNGPIGYPEADSLSIDIDLKDYNLSQIFNSVNIPIEFELKKNKDVSGLSIDCTVPWAGATVTISATVGNEKEGVLVLQTENAIGLPTATDFKNLFGGQDFLSFLPAQFSGGKSISISKLKIGIGTRTKKIEYIDVVISALSGQKLDVLSPYITVGNINFYASFYDPFGQNPSSIFTFDGEIYIDDVGFVVSAQFSPALQLSATLDALNSKPLSLTKVAEHFGLPAGALDIVVSEMMVGAVPPDVYSLSIQLENHTIPANKNGFTLSNLGFALLKTKTDTQLQFNGQLSIAGVNLNISIDNSSGWELKIASGEDEELPLGNLITELASEFDHTFKAEETLKNFTLKNLILDVKFDGSLFHFALTCDFPIDQNENVEITVTVDATKNAAGMDVALAGKCAIDGNVFEVTFENAPDKKITASWKDQTKTLSLDKMADFFHLKDFPQEPGFLKPYIDLNQVSFSYDFDSKELTLSASSAKGEIFLISTLPTTGKRTFLVGLKLDLNVGFNDIPFLGSQIEVSEAPSIKDFDVFISSSVIAKDDVAATNQLIKSQFSDFDIQIPVEGIANPGFILGATLQVGTSAYPFQLDLGGSSKSNQSKTGSGTNTGTGTGNPAVPEPRSSASSQPASWINIQKRVGPVYLDKIGINYKDSVIWFMLNGSVSMAGIKLTFVGLSFGSPLEKIDIKFHLQGLGLDYTNGPIEIGGAFLDVDPPTAANATMQFDGEAIIKAETFTLAAVGSYSNPGGHPSMFIFAEVDSDFGGPPYFFITGLAAGFGYNSKINLPDQNQVVDFPLVQGLNNQTDPINVLEILEGRSGANKKVWVEAYLGNEWLAFGIHFTSFDLVNGKALLIAEFGEEFELALLGIASAKLPQAGSETYAFVELGLEAKFLPEEGFFGLSAVVSNNSFVIDRACTITGGFALYTWFGNNTHAGDFVLTVGGYHPDFPKPAWYPDEKRLGFCWNVDSNVTISGGAYFALTPTCVMGGGSLSVVYHSGNLKAWFDAYANFLVYWKPFHYIASIGVSVGASYRVNLLLCHKTLKVSLGADLTIWGPPTGGKVHVDWFVISFTVHFGSDQNSGGGYLGWDDFKTLLPGNGSDQSVNKIQVINGLLSSKKDATNTKISQWFVRSDEFEFTTECAIPSTSIATTTKSAALVASSGGLDIRPMGRSGESSNQVVTITSNGNEIDLDVEKWTVTQIKKNVPDAMWGTPLEEYTTPPAAANLIYGKLTGLHIKAPEAQLGASAGPIDVTKNLSYEPLTPDGVLSFPITPVEDSNVPQVSATAISTIASTLSDATVVARRTGIYDDLKTAGIYSGPNDSLDETVSDINNIFNEEPMLSSTT